MNEIRPPKTGTLDATGVYVFPVAQLITMPPYMFTLNSAAAGRKIELSTDGGTIFDEKTSSYDTQIASQLAINVTGQVTHVKFTGQAGDTWRAQ